MTLWSDQLLETSVFLEVQVGDAVIVYSIRVRSLNFVGLPVPKMWLIFRSRR